MRVTSLFFFGCAVISGAAAAAPALETGEIAGAHFAIARPERWNGNVLILAHGYRPESAPLIADLQPHRGAYQVLLREGWVLAKTSYRRNGVIVHDAMEDIDRLRAEIVNRVGRPARVIIEGDSMGGLIAVLLAERPFDEQPPYDGVVAVGPALNMRDPSASGAGLNMQPQVPVVFLCNRDEIEAARQYTELKLPGSARPSTPVLLRVSRDGHINVNQAERLAALRALNAWLDFGRDSLPRPEQGVSYIDVTKVPEPSPSRVFMNSDKRGFTAHLTEVTPVFGNLLLDVQSADLAAIGLVRNAYFQITIGEKTLRVQYGRDLESVKRGEWVMFENADGFFWLARKGLSAAAETNAQVGDLVHAIRYSGQ